MLRERVIKLAFILFVPTFNDVTETVKTLILVLKIGIGNLSISFFQVKQYFVQ